MSPPDYAARAADWRCGAIVYQVLVDRFAPPARPQAKRALYPPPKTLRGWHETPTRGRFLPEQRVWSHEIDFWGGDLASVASQLDHVQALGAEVLYLNPICHAYTHHKYDALDYDRVSPEYGTRDDAKALAAELHRRGMKLVLDGVFNHMGRHAPAFQRALADPAAPERADFCFDDSVPGGVRCWWRAENLPELNLENPDLRRRLWNAPGSVVRGWLRDGADGWRLDVAYDIGPAWLAELRAAAHAEKPGALVLGEIPNWPAGWLRAVDGVLLFGLRRLLITFAAGQIAPAVLTTLLERLLADAGTEGLLKSWLYLENHDTPRLATVLPDEASRRLAQLLQFTLPGSPNLYYGGEVDMEGGDDPANRAPMRWDRVQAGHPALAWTTRLAALHKSQRALRIGDWRPLLGSRLFGFERHTERAAESVLVIVNPADRPAEDLLLVPDSWLMDGVPMTDLLGNLPGEPPRLQAGLLAITLPAKGSAVLQPQAAAVGGYTPYKRIT